MPKRKAAPKKRPMTAPASDGAATSSATSSSPTAAADCSAERTSPRSDVSLVAPTPEVKAKAAQRRKRSVSPKKVRLEKKAKSSTSSPTPSPTPVSTEYVPIFPANLYKPEGIYCDLGYLAFDKETAGLKDDTWKAKVYTFNIQLDLQQLKDGAKDRSVQQCMEELRKMSHCRIVWKNPESASDQPSTSFELQSLEDSGVLFHLPYEVAKACGLPLAIEGSMFFPEMPPPGRPGGWSLWSISPTLQKYSSVFPHDTPVRHVDALRYFAMPSIPQSKDDSGYKISLAPVPTWDKQTYQWQYCGKAMHGGVLPRRYDVMTEPGQQMVFLATLDEKFEETGQIRVEAYVTEEFMAAFGQEDDVPNMHTLKTGKRFKFLLDSMAKSSLSENAFLENLIVEKKYEPVRVASAGNAIGQNVGLDTLNQLFDFVKTTHADQRISEKHNPQHKNLKLKMHGYQKRAVSWMIEKEQAVLENVSRPHPLYFPVQTTDGNQFYMHYSSGRICRTMPFAKTPRGGILADEMGLGKTLEVLSLISVNSKEYLDPHLPDDFFSASLHPDQSAQLQCYCPSSDPESAVRKKTLKKIFCAQCGAKVHAVCVGAEHIPEGQVYLCSSCQQENRIECKTTLVVAPGAIVAQWKTEITKSAKHLSVYEYTGIRTKNGFGSVSPWELAEYDIVLASYEILSKELLYVNAEQRKASLRTRSVKQHYSSPLLSLKFWRFILDEAQMVESQTTNFAVMAMKINADFYWAVTGTPVTRTVWDTQSLLRFIEMEPWSSARWFEEYIAGPFQAKIFTPLQNLLSECMWRLEKRDVEAEMDLPKCTTVLHSVMLSGIEQQMYGQVYRDCIKMIMANLKNNKTLGSSSFDTQFTSLDGSVVRTVKDWMARLAKLCASPTRVSYFFRVTKRTKVGEVDDKADSLTKVLKTLLEKARLALIGSVRASIMDHNALAAYYWLEEKYDEAADQYRAAKRLWHENEQLVPVDLLQKLHILTNLGHLLAAHGDAIAGRSLEDDQLLAQAEALRVEFMARKGADRLGSIERLRTTWDIPHTQEDLTRRIKPVYLALRMVKEDNETAFLTHVKMANIASTSIRSRNDTNSYIRSRAMPATYDSINGLKFVLQSRWDEIIITVRNDLDKAMKDLIQSSAPEVEQFPLDCAACHLRNVGTVKEKCLLCKAEKKFLAYEDLIFRTEQLADEDDEVIASVAYRKRRRFDKEEEDGSRLTTYHDGDFEMACKAVVQFVKHNSSTDAFRTVEKDLDSFFAVLASLKKEYKLWKELWAAVYDYTSSIDEVKQALMRVRFQTEEEMEIRKALKAGPEKKKLGILLAGTIPLGENLTMRIFSGKQSLKSNIAELARDATHFKYIRNMHEGYTQANEVKTRECCVCFDPVGEEWALFPCAHVMCEGCLKKMTEMARVEIQHHQSMQCPVCRASTSVREIVRASGISDVFTSMVTTQRRFNTANLRGAPSKVEAVVKKVFELIEKEPDVKILIFSDYPDVLDDYHQTLLRNGIQSRLVKSKGHIPASIAALRSGSVRTMLMPIALGGKGLTIIEATHVFFLEPLFNKGIEQQAIGRIHRMGQTKETFVHKFIVSGTVEERIYELMESIGDEGSLLQKDLTLGQVLELLKSGDVHGPDMDDLNQWIERTRSADSSMVVEEVSS